MPSPAPAMNCDSRFHPPADHVPRSPHGADQLERMSLVHLGPQVAHIDVYDVGNAVKTLVPNVFDDHVPGEHSLRILHEILQKRVLLSGEFHALSAPFYLLRQAIKLEVPDTQSAGPVDRS